MVGWGRGERGEAAAELDGVRTQSVQGVEHNANSFELPKPKLRPRRYRRFQTFLQNTIQGFPVPINHKNCISFYYRSIQTECIVNKMYLTKFLVYPSLQVLSITTHNSIIRNDIVTKFSTSYHRYMVSKLINAIVKFNRNSQETRLNNNL